MRHVLQQNAEKPAASEDSSRSHVLNSRSIRRLWRAARFGELRPDAYQRPAESRLVGRPVHWLKPHRRCLFIINGESVGGLSLLIARSFRNGHSAELPVPAAC